MRELTGDEQETLRQRRLDLEALKADRMQVLAEIWERLGVVESPSHLTDPVSHLEQLSGVIRALELTDETRVWWSKRLGHLLGEIFNQRYGGTWILNESPSSRYFLRIVVGELSRTKSLNSVVDPFGIAESVLDEAKSADLLGLLEDVDNALGE